MHGYSDDPHWTTEGPPTTTEESLEISEVYESPAGKTIGTVMIVISIVLLAALLLCDLPKLYRDVTGKSFKRAPRRRKRPKAKTPPEDRSSSTSAGSSSSSSPPGRTANVTPIKLFTVHDRDSDSDDNWDTERRPGSSCQRKMSQEQLDKEKQREEDEMLIQL